MVELYFFLPPPFVKLLPNPTELIVKARRLFYLRCSLLQPNASPDVFGCYPIVNLHVPQSCFFFKLPLYPFFVSNGLVLASPPPFVVPVPFGTLDFRCLLSPLNRVTSSIPFFQPTQVYIRCFFSYIQRFFFFFILKPWWIDIFFRPPPFLPVVPPFLFPRRF